MKYLLFIVFFLLFNSCGSSKKSHTFSATLIDGYVRDANISIDDNNQTLKVLNTNSNGYFSYTNTKNELLYVKSSSGIDNHYDEVSKSIFYGVLIKNKHSILSPLSSLLWAYHSKHKAEKYTIARDIIKTKLNISKDFLSFNPISNISDKESSFIIQKMLIFNFVSQLVNSALGASYEDSFYYSAYLGLKTSTDLSFLHSESFMYDLSKSISSSYAYMNEGETKLKLMALRESIAYFISEIFYFKADNETDLKKNYKSAYILSYPIIREVGLLDKIENNNSDVLAFSASLGNQTFASQGNDIINALAFFNSFNSKISDSQISDIIDGLKIVGGFRGILSKLNNINRATTYVKPSFFADEFLSKKSLIKYATIHKHINLSTVSGAPSQDVFKEEMLKNILSLRVENSDILSKDIFSHIQNQIDLLITVSKKDAIYTNVEKLVHKARIGDNKKFFLDKVNAINSLISDNENLAKKIAKVNDNILKIINNNALSVNRANRLIMEDFQASKQKEKDMFNKLISTSIDTNIVEFSKKLTLLKSKAKLLKQEIEYSLAELKYKNTNFKLDYIEDTDTKYNLLSSKIEINVEKNKEKIHLEVLKNTVKFNQDVINKLKNTLKTPELFKVALKEAQKDKKETNKEAVKLSIMDEASNILYIKIRATNIKIESREKEYETILAKASESLSNGNDISTYIATLSSLYIYLTALEESKKHVIVYKEDLKSYTRPIIPDIELTINGSKSCYSKNENDIFTITTNNINGTTTTITATGIPDNTIFSNNKLKKKLNIGFDIYKIPLGSYSVRIKAISSNPRISSENRTVNFEIKEHCKEISAAHNAPAGIGIPNIPSLNRPELDTNKSVPNPNDITTVPDLEDEPPKNN